MYFKGTFGPKIQSQKRLWHSVMHLSYLQSIQGTFYQFVCSGLNDLDTAINIYHQ